MYSLNINTQHVRASKVNISRYGKLTEWSQTIEGVYNPETRKVENTEVSHYIKSFQTGATKDDVKDPLLITKESCVFLVAGSDITGVPEQGDLFTVLIEYPSVTPLDWETFFNGEPATNKETFRVETVRKRYAGDKVALYRIFCLRG